MTKLHIIDNVERILELLKTDFEKVENTLTMTEGNLKSSVKSRVRSKTVLAEIRP